MDADQTTLLAGLLFLLIAVVGGGFAIKEIRIPKVPIWARAVSMVVGLALVAPFFLKHLGLIDAENGALPPEDRTAAGPVRLHVDAGPAQSRHGLTMKELIAQASRQPPRTGESVTFAFTLLNSGERPFTFDEIFVAARGPAAEHRDFGWSHQALTLAPDATIQYKTSMVPDFPGVWTFWPCYTVMSETGEREYCPERWRAFQVSVVD